MSGATIGGVVGAVVGFWIGGPQGAQWGWAIGSAIGGYVDPTIITGPRLQDARVQTARDGVAIPFGWGRFPTAGNIIWIQPGPPTEHKHEERQGKGGPVTETFTYTRSYAIGICEGPIAGLLQIKRNGKLVYDARTDIELIEEYFNAGLNLSGAIHRARMRRAENTAFIVKCTFYNGTEDQLPSDVIEAWKGVGNVPAYRGLAYMVVEDDDVTELSGAVPQYEFVVSVCGDEVTQGGSDLVHWLTIPDTSGTGDYNYHVLRASADSIDWGHDPIAHGGGEQFNRIATHDQEVLLSSSGSLVVSYSEDRGETWINSTRATADTGNSGRAAKLLGYWWVCNGSTEPVSRSADAISWEEPDSSVQSNLFDILQVSGRLIGTTVFNNPGTVSISDDIGETWTWVATAGSGGNLFPTIDTNGVRAVIATARNSGLGSIVQMMHSDDRGDTWTLDTTPFLEVTNPDSAVHYSADLSIWVAANGDGVIAYSFDGSVWLLATSPLSSGDIVYEFASGNGVIMASCSGSQLLRSTDGQTWSAVTVPNPPVSAFQSVAYLGIPGTSIPDAPGWYIDPDGNVVGPDYTFIETCENTLDEIVGGLCEREGLDPSEYDVTDLAAIDVPGFRVANEGDAASAIQATAPYGMFDSGEWDGKVRFIRRGGTSVGSINGDDLVVRDGDPFERQRVQEAELLRRATVGYIDPAASYGPTTQKYERRVSTVRAMGEASMEVPLTLTTDAAATLVKRRVLVAWGEPEKQKFSLPYRLAKYTPTDILNFTDNRGEVHTIRLMAVDDESGVRIIESSSNSAEAYNATATGVPPSSPAITDGNLRGPTILEAMNLDSLRAQDNVPGMYFAAVGLLPAWQGCLVQMSTDGGVTFRDLTNIVTPATMGFLSDSIGTSGEPIAVNLYADGQLSTVTTAQIASGANAAAILTDDVAEIIQFEDATATTDGYDLTTITRGVRDTVPAAHASGDSFVMLDGNVVFAPISEAFAGMTLVFRAVTFNTSSDAAETISVVYDPPTFVIDGGVVT